MGDLPFAGDLPHPVSWEISHTHTSTFQTLFLDEYNSFIMGKRITTSFFLKIFTSVLSATKRDGSVRRARSAYTRLLALHHTMNIEAHNIRYYKTFSSILSNIVRWFHQNRHFGSRHGSSRLASYLPIILGIGDKNITQEKERLFSILESSWCVGW